MTRVRNLLTKRDVARLPEMQREQIRAASCTGKQKLTVETARMLARRAGKAVDPYRCAFCGHYHIGRFS